MKAEDAKKKVEDIYSKSLDHIHVDMVQRYIDEQEEKYKEAISDLQKLYDEVQKAEYYFQDVDLVDGIAEKYNLVERY